MMRRLSPLSLATLVAVAGCGGDDEQGEEAAPSEDLWATVAIAGTSVDYSLDTCEVDGSTVRLDGLGEIGEVLEATFELGDDGATGRPESVAISLRDFDRQNLAAYGDGRWADQGFLDDTGLGTSLAARVNGDLVQMAGQIVTVDEDGQPTGDSPSSPLTFVLDATCDLGG